MQCPCIGIPRNFIPPEGSDTPKIYIVGEAPGLEESLQKKQFVSKSGEILRSALTDAGLTMDNVRLFNVVGCRPIDIDGGTRTPTSEEMANCSILVKNDIIRKSPEVILCLGSATFSAFFPENTESITSTIGNDYDWNGFLLRSFYSLKYLDKRGGKSAPEYKMFVNYLKSLKGDAVFIPPTEIIDLSDPKYPIVLSELVHDYDRYGLDIEATSLESYTEDFRIIGTGVSSHDRSVYFSAPNPEDRQKMLDHKDLWLALMKNKNYVYNMGFEGVAFTRLFEVPIHELNFIDVMQYATIKGERTNLKSLAQTKLGFPDWEREIGNFNSAYNSFMSSITPTSSGRLRKEYEILIDEDPNKNPYLLERLLQYLVSIENKDKRQLELTKAANYMITNLPKYWDVDKINDVTRKLVVASTLPNKGAYYELIPVEVVGKYCGADCYSTLKLADDYEENFSDSEKRSIPTFNKHAKLAVIITSSGVTWDDDEAEKLKIFYASEMLKRMKYLLTNPLYIKANSISTHDIIKIMSCTDHDELVNTYYNPGSHTQYSKFRDTIGTDQFMIVMILNELKTKLSNDELKASWTVYRLITAFLANKTPEDRKKYVNELISDGLSKLEPIMKEDSSLLEVWNTYVGKKFALDAPSIENMHQAFTMIGVDADKPDEWPYEYKEIFDFRYYKKVKKSLTSYVEGSVGRGGVWTVDKSSLLNPCPTRLKKYVHGYKLDKSKELYTLHPEYSYNSAETRRWRSKMHVIPWGGELRDIQVSRWDDGLILHVDYSQMEVRCLAKMANEQSMLDAYARGADIHRFVAASVWRKKEEDVLEEERRFSKMATFSILYGKSRYAFAMDFMKGDTEATDNLFNSFFTSFPGVETFVNNCHKSVIENQYVESLMGDRIIIPYDEFMSKSEKGKALRNGQNYPVQESASNLAGEGLYDLSYAAYLEKIYLSIFGFTHDAGDFDIRAKDLLTILRLIKENMENKVLEKYGIPAKVDYEIGISGNRMIELDLEESSKDHLVAEFSGTEEAYHSVKSHLEKVIGPSGVKMELTKDVKEDFKSMNLLFMNKLAFCRDFGTTIRKVKGKLELKI